MIPKIGYRGPFIVAIPLAFEVVLVLVLSVLLNSTEEEILKQKQARDIIDHCSVLSYDMTNAVTMTALAANLPIKGLAKRRKESIRGVKHELAVLRDLCGKDTSQLALLREVSLATERCLHELAFIQGKRKTSSLSDLLGDSKNFNHANELVLGMGLPITKFLKSASATDVESPIRQYQLKVGVMTALAAGTMVNIILAVIMAIYTVRSITKPLSVLSDNTRRLTSQLPLNPSLPGSDEISYIDRNFHEMYRQLETTDRQRKQMAGLVANRLQLPLSRVQQGVTELRNGDLGALPEAVRNRLLIAETGLLRITSLLYDLMNYEQMDRGTLILKQSLQRLRPLLEQCVQALHGYFSQKKLTIVLSEFDTDVYMDAQRIGQVIINLLSNAVKFTPSGQQITIECKEAAGEQVEIAVIDEGPGIPSDKLETIFAEFQQASVEDAVLRGGFGLGLSICKTIVSQHGGQIGAENLKGGSRFWFRLPRFQGRET